MSPSSTVHGGQQHTKCVTFELVLHAAFVADEIWGDTLEPAVVSTCTSSVLISNENGNRYDNIDFEINYSQFANLN